MALTGQRERHIWIAAKGHQLLSAIEAILPTPELSTGRSDFKVDSAAIAQFDMQSVVAWLCGLRCQ